MERQEIEIGPSPVGRNPFFFETRKKMLSPLSLEEETA
jgi:hypothetical protein